VGPKHRTCDDAAGVPDPSGLEVLLTRLMLHGVMSGAYRKWVVSIGLRGDERVLDYGSGSGAAARHLAKVLEAGGGSLTCADISPAWQAALRKTLAGCEVEYALGDIRRLELLAGSFDVVVMHWMFHDVPAADRRAVLDELARLLRPGGRLATREPTRREEGIPAVQLRGLLKGAGLRELRGFEASAFMMGPYYSGVWEKPEAAEAAEGGDGR
jgi:ubiquinone/menaquinone biosynthesis C-methylase UbiE